MAAASFRRAPGLCCIHRELCRLVWRPQMFFFSSKTSGRNQPRRTHIRKAEPQPPLDVAKLLEQIFSHRRPGAAPPAAHPAPAPSTPTRPPTSIAGTPHSEAALSSAVKTHRRAPPSSTQVFAADGFFNATRTSGSPKPHETPAETKVAQMECQTSVETIESSTETFERETTFIDVAVEPTTEPPVELPVKASLSPGEALERPVEAPGEEVQTKSINSEVSHAATVEPATEPPLELPVETIVSPVEALERPVEPLVEAPVGKVRTDPGVVISSASTVEPLVEARVEPSTEARHSTLPGTAAACAECTIGTIASQPGETSSPPGVGHLSHAAQEALVEARVERPVEGSASPVKNLAANTEGTVEPAVGTRVDAAADELLHAVLPSENEIEPSLESSRGTEGGVKESEEMTLESVTLHLVNVLVQSLRTDELSNTKVVLDEKAEKQLQELLVQSGIGAEYKAAVEEENSTEFEQEVLNKVLLKWESLSEDLQELEGAAGVLFKDLLCYIPGVLSKNTKPSSDPAEAVMVESVTSADVKTEGGSFENTEMTPEKEVEVEMGRESATVLTLNSTPETTIPSGAEGEPSPPSESLTGQNQDEVTMQDECIVEALTLESVTLAEIESSLRTLESESLNETKAYLEEAAEVLAAETIPEGPASEEEAEAQTLDSLPEADDLEDLQAETLMEELLFALPGPEAGPREGQTGLEDEVENIPRATSATVSEVTDELPIVVNEEDEGGASEFPHTDLDPVQRLFLEKIREYNNMHSGERVEEDPDYEQYLSDEIRKLQRLHGGGDLGSFPQFTFPEPNMDLDAK
ncbi:uncharacterized protein ACBR49_009164 [Aulostomus maculatus]